MGRNAKLKKKRREERQQAEHEGWAYFTSRRFLGEVQRLIRDSKMNLESSICCTKVLRELATDMGLKITPLSVEVTVYNPIFADHIEEHGIDPSEEDVHRLGEAGGRYVTLGSRKLKTEKKDEWHGYVVAVLKAANKPAMVLDISIGQASRPNDDILCAYPVIFGCPSGFLKGKCCAVGFHPMPSGKNCCVYRAFPDDEDFKKTTDWLRDYGAKTHDKIEFGDMPETTPEEAVEGCPTGHPGEQGPPGPSLIVPEKPRLLGLDGMPLGE